mmetsp:Transcript_31554/g.106265  ORF Transcript_31554/g.106265 Transcript_31554/m.106265 type:complete len:258 (-) Transcript_31554:1378-2151(-)
MLGRAHQADERGPRGRAHHQVPRVGGALPEEAAFVARRRGARAAEAGVHHQYRVRRRHAGGSHHPARRHFHVLHAENGQDARRLDGLLHARALLPPPAAAGVPALCPHQLSGLPRLVQAHYKLFELRRAQGRRRDPRLRLRRNRRPARRGVVRLGPRGARKRARGPPDRQRRGRGAVAGRHGADVRRLDRGQTSVVLLAQVDEFVLLPDEEVSRRRGAGRRGAAADEAVGEVGAVQVGGEGGGRRRGTAACDARDAG